MHLMVLIAYLVFFAMELRALRALSVYQCEHSLFQYQRDQGYNKFYDPQYCQHEGTDCDPFNCRLCIEIEHYKSSELVLSANNVTLCSTPPEATVDLTPAQEEARKLVGITREQMKMVVVSAKECQLKNDTTPANDAIYNDVRFEEAATKLCKDFISIGHANFGISMFFDRTCPNAHGCNSKLTMSTFGGCRYCKLAECKGDCQHDWEECPMYAASAVTFKSFEAYILSESGFGALEGFALAVGAICVIGAAALIGIYLIRSTGGSAPNNENEIDNFDNVNEQNIRLQGARLGESA